MRMNRMAVRSTPETIPSELGETLGARAVKDIDAPKKHPSRQ
jgi:hypothetical protein